MSHGGHGHGGGEGGENKKIAILISILALFLAISETVGKSAQTNALTYNIEASNLWAFYKAKTIRKTTMETAAEQMERRFHRGVTRDDDFITWSLMEPENGAAAPIFMPNARASAACNASRRNPMQVFGQSLVYLSCFGSL